jgi:ABC-type nitrate/sulfonate/bicarbonate transport system permease component
LTKPTPQQISRFEQLIARSRTQVALQGTPALARHLAATLAHTAAGQALAQALAAALPPPIGAPR